MKVKIEIDCTPEEARAFFGLPDLSGVQELATDAMKARVTEAIAATDPQELFKAWFSGGTAKAMAEGFQTLQKAFWAQAGKRSDDSER